MADKTVAIIGARLGSSRLPGKQLLPLVGSPLLTHTVRRLRAVSAIDAVILATTDDAENRRLVDWAEAEGVTPFAWNGDENDLMGRIDAAFHESGADRFVYVCGDCALVHPNTIEKLIEASVLAGGGGFAGLAPLPHRQKYIHEGFDVYNKAFWSMMMEAAILPFEREHVGAVYHHQKKVEPSKIMHVEDEAVFTNIKHRLSVDTRRDYLFMRRLYEDWYAGNADDTLVDLRWVVQRLKTEPELVSINAHVHQKTADEVPPKIILWCEAGPSVGLGHLSRACVAAAAMQDHLGAAVKLVVKGDPVKFSELDLLPHEWVKEFSEKHTVCDALIVDVKSLSDSQQAVIRAARNDTKTIVIDSVRDCGGLFDLNWMPSAYVDPVSKKRLGSKLNYGFECYLLRDALCSSGQVSPPKLSPHKRVVVLTGGSDPAKLCETLPSQLIQSLPAQVKIDWIKGPYADDVDIDTNHRGRFQIIDSPDDLPSLLSGYDAALCVYGVSFYECLKAGIPTAVFDPLDAALPAEWGMLARLMPEFVCIDSDHAIEQLVGLLDGDNSVPNSVNLALKSGSRNFAETVRSLIYPEKLRVAHDRA